MSLPPVVVALDVPTPTAAEALVAKLSHLPVGFKVGMELFYGAGLPWVQRLQGQMATPIFVDLKLHDIPNTVARTAAQLVRGGVRWFNVHATGGQAMMAAALEGAVTALPATESVERLTILGVTVLTSLNAETVRDELHVGLPLADYVQMLAGNAQQAGLHGVVCSAQEAGLIKATCGDRFLRVTPGIRLAGGEVGDQQRVLTPAAAKAQGASVLVVGRSITAAPDPVAAAEAVLAELNAPVASYVS